MKRLLAPLVLAAATALTATAPAQAFTPGGPFTLAGPMTIKVGGAVLPCTAVLQVVGTPGSGGSVVAVSITGSTLCLSLRAAGLPWAMTMTSPGSLTIMNVAINGPIPCGPANVPATWSNAAPGVMTVTSATLPASCQIVSATLSASPPQTLP
jgi:hypothetical protein